MAVLTRIVSRRTLALASGAAAASAVGSYYYLNSGPTYPLSTTQSRRPPPPWTPPTRQDMLRRLTSTKDGEEFDLLIVGGGATGAGVAVDAATRGLKVALVERDDFSAGTSSKSTKLVHGGVRYLQKAVMELDYEQYKLVKEALHERRIFLSTAPYLSHMLPIMLPIYKYWQVPYYWAGCKMYDILAGKENMESSYVMSRGKALEAFPMLKPEGLVGAIVYYDGQHNDSRMNMALIMTAVKHGATVVNHVEVTALDKDPATGKLQGAGVRDNLTGKTWNIKARGVINATGPFSDQLLALDNPSHTPIVQPAAGVHITLPNYYAPRTMGLIDPATSDGRVIFFLPWQGNVIAGTTDSPCAIEAEPVPREEDVAWVLDEVRRYLSPDIKVRRGDVLSAWSGIRPLVRNPSAASTEGLVRNHMIHVSDSGLLTIAGGKWTTYRKMAEETVDEAVKAFDLQALSGCVTESVRLLGSEHWTRNMFMNLIQRYGLTTDVAQHLSENYGDRAWTVCSLAEPTGEYWPIHGKRLSPQYPFIEAEVRYAARYEYAETAVDVIARRTRLSFLNAQAARVALPRILDILSEERGWDGKRRAQEQARALEFLRSMGLPSIASTTDTGPGFFASWADRARSALHLSPTTRTVDILPPVQYARSEFEAGEVDALRDAFEAAANSSPIDNKEFTSPETSRANVRLPRDAIRSLLRSLPDYARAREGELRSVLNETGLDSRNDFDFNDFIEICAGLKELTQTPVAKTGKTKTERMRIPVEKSGGGV